MGSGDDCSLPACCALLGVALGWLAPFQSPFLVANQPWLDPQADNAAHYLELINSTRENLKRKEEQLAKLTVELEHVKQQKSVAAGLTDTEAQKENARLNEELQHLIDKYTEALEMMREEKSELEGYRQKLVEVRTKKAWDSKLRGTVKFAIVLVVTTFASYRFGTKSTKSHHLWKYILDTMCFLVNPGKMIAFIAQYPFGAVSNALKARSFLCNAVPMPQFCDMVGNLAGFDVSVLGTHPIYGCEGWLSDPSRLLADGTKLMLPGGLGYWTGFLAGLLVDIFLSFFCAYLLDQIAKGIGQRAHAQTSRFCELMHPFGRKRSHEEAFFSDSEAGSNDGYLTPPRPTKRARHC